jgi:hypothetical protein
MHTSHPPVSSARWALDIVRDLRAAESAEQLMVLVADLARCATGCVDSELVDGKPRAKSAGQSAVVAPAALLASECLAVGCVLSATVRGADPGWDDVLVSTKPAEAHLHTDERVVLLACYLPNGAGRHPAALVLSFDADIAPEPGTVERVQAYAELADEAIGYRYATEQIASLRTALETNREIGTAMGILMVSRRVSDDDAFELLRAESQRSRRKLGVVAAEVVYAGTLPR